MNLGQDWTESEERPVGAFPVRVARGIWPTGKKGWNEGVGTVGEVESGMVKG